MHELPSASMKVTSSEQHNQARKSEAQLELNNLNLLFSRQREELDKSTTPINKLSKSRSVW
jgi:hypothetical protein